MKTMMIATLAATAALALAVQPAAAANTKARPSDDLNRQQLAMYQQDMANREAQPAAAPTTVVYAETDERASNEPTNVIVVGPAHSVSESDPEPTTNPQSMGTPMVETPYIAVVPKN